MSDTAKKGILVVSFGTSHEDTRAVTIDAIEKEIGAAFAGNRRRTRILAFSHSPSVEAVLQAVSRRRQ